MLALEDGRRDDGLAIGKRERQDSGFGMETMERRRWFCNGEDQKRERRDGGFGMEMMERRGGGFAMEKRERSVRQRFRIGREGRRTVTESKSKSIYPSIKKATPY